MSDTDWILNIVQRFYDKAKSDILIGYHFRNIADFETHIPRIASFWEIQLLGKTHRVIDQNFDVLKAHLPLGIKKALKDGSKFDGISSCLLFVEKRRYID